MKLGAQRIPDEQQALSGCRVLVVEDEWFLADDLRVALKSLGADVIALAGDLDDARDQLAHGEFDVGIIDIKLRGREAFDVADQLQRREIPFVFSTGYGAHVIPIRFADVIRWEKPFEPQVVLRDLVRLWRGDNR
jgi:CheY-like chemotaxis protein